MKKFVLTLLLLITILSLFSCVDSQHTHDYSAGWEKNETHHWKACAASDCDSRVATSEHSFAEGNDLGNGNTRFTCSVCSYEKVSHEHSIRSEYAKDETYHWNECAHEGCGFYGTKTEHSYGEITLVEDKEVKVCSVCEYKSEKPHSHTYTGVPVSTEEGHYIPCSLPHCTSNSELFEHDFGLPTLSEGLDLFVCSVCEYSRKQAHVHILYDEWRSDDHAHWKVCEVQGCGHTDENAAHNWVSEGVTKQPTPEENGEEKFVCDVCGLGSVVELEYTYPKMTEAEWLSRFVFDNLKLENTYSFGEGETVDTWCIDGENVLITGDSGSSYGSPEDLMSFAFLKDYYELFDVVGEGQYFAEEILHYNATIEDNEVYRNVTVCFSDAKILKIEFTVDFGIFGALSDRYDFIEWGGIVVPDNPREVVFSPESISEMLGNSLENFKMTETVTAEGYTTYSEYCFDGDRYSVRTDGEDAVSDVMADAGADFALGSVGFFYSLNEEGFSLDSEMSDESILVYVYECGITADGIDYDSVTVTLTYESEALLEISFSYTLALFGAAEYEYVFSDFGSAVVEAEATLIHELAGKSVKQVSAMLNVYDGSQNVFSSYYFDYSDYSFITMDGEQTVASLKDSAAVYIANWLGTLPEINPTDFVCEENTNTSRIYSAVLPVTSCGVTYASTRVSLTYEGNDIDGYELRSIEIAFSEGENGGNASYYFYDFGNTYVDTPVEEEKEIPEGYITELTEGASLLNYTLSAYEVYFLDGEYLTESNLMYEFDSHKGRLYERGTPENSQYVSEEYVGMAYATDTLGLLALLDPSGFTLVSDKGSDKSEKLAYEYVGNAVIGEITLKNIVVNICSEGGVLTSVDISYSMSVSTDFGDSLSNLFYCFYSFGETTVVLPEDETVVKFGYERFDIANYEYTTSALIAESESFGAAGRYDGNTYYESSSESGNNYGFAENAGLLGFLRNFGWMTRSFSIDELVYSEKNNYKGYDTAVIYTCSAIKQFRAPIGDTYHDIIASSFSFTFCYEGSELSEVIVEYVGMIDGVSYEISSTLSGFGEQSVVLP